MWRISVILIIQLIHLELICGQASVGNDDPPIGAYRVFPKTKFQCTGRPSGYYADIDAGCQVYHMCDGLGRQFSYSCPNTTLFQQRMLICDHWYMVNCSKSESNYAANLLIGQRDKPFVEEHEHELRTPRPDLLDRPYASDYAGESFRNNYKTNILPAIQNAIAGVDYKKQYPRKTQPQQPQPIQQRQQQQQQQQHQQLPQRKHQFQQQQIVPPTRRSTLNPSSRFESTTTTATQSLNFIKQTNNNNNNNYNRRSNQNEIGNFNDIAQKRIGNDADDEFLIDVPSSHTNDLGTSSSQADTKTLNEVNGNNLNINVPSIYYTVPTTDPTTSIPAPLSNEIFKINAEISTNYNITDSKLNAIPSTTTTPTTQIFTTKLPQQFNLFKTGFANVNNNNNNNNKFSEFKNVANDFDNINGKKFNKILTKDDVKGRILTGSSKVPSTTAAGASSPIQLPSVELLPPFENFITHDDATTQGPPIYYEWKIPFEHFELPKFNDDRQIVNNNFAKSSSENINSIINLNAQPKSLSSLDSISELTSSSSSSSSSSAATTVSSSTTEKYNYLLNLQKSHFIPEFTFPLENGERTSYQTGSHSVNSFQIKIPEKINKNWYGENAVCPECHPAFTKPGTCEPCIKL